jgi:hypothetical protein
MHYKTMVLELLQDRPQLHHRLRKNRTLLDAVEFLAIELKDRSQAWKERLSQVRPESAPEQLASEALELAIQGLEDSFLLSESPDEGEELSLDETMAFLRRHTPPA